MIDLNGLVHVWSKVKTLTDNCVKADTLATVATSGSYNDLSDKPTIPSAYTLPTASSSVLGGVKIGSNISVSSGTISITKSNVTSALGYTPPASDTVYNNATTSTAGLMSAADKIKLNSIASNANNYTHPSTHPASMITGLAGVATSGSYNDLTDKPTIPASSTVDSELSSTSTNPVQNKVINAALNSKADSSVLSAYLPLAGGACTGGVSAPNFQTGTGTTNYFQCRKFRGEGDANTYYHAVDFGYSGHDSVDFYEYDANWNFYQCTTGTKSGAVLVGNINGNGWNGGAVLSGTPTAPTATAGTNTAQIATTAFVQTAVSSKVSASALAAIATTGDYNDLTNKPAIPAAYTLPTASSSVLGGVKIGSNISVSGGVISLTRANVTGALGYTPPVSDTTYVNATASAAGLMSSTDKSKLDSIAANANNYVHPASHPVNMITGLAAVATSGSYNDLSDRPAIPVVDDSLSSESTNAVQNKVVYGLGQKFFNQLSALASVARTGSYSDLTGTPGNATPSAAGLMSAADKAKLDKVDADAGSVKLITYS
nr:MAG TPA: Baseplate wedge protein [Caudoviricetes sp.]